MKNGIKRNGACIKACVLMWIVLPVLLLCASISSAEAGNCTYMQEAGAGLNQKTVTDSEIHALEKCLIDSEHESDSENSIAGQCNIENKLYLKSEDNSGSKKSDVAVKSESGSSNLVKKTSENDKESTGSEGVDCKKNLDTEVDINTDNPQSTVQNSDQETKAGSNNIESSDKNELSLEQKITVKSNTATTESTGTSLAQKTGTDVSTETKSSGNQGVLAELKTVAATFSAVTSSTSEGVTTVSKTNVAQKKLCSCATTTPQKTDTNSDSSSSNSNSNSNSNNSNSNSNSNNSSSNSSSNNSSSNSSSNNSSSNSSFNNSSSNSSDVNLSSDQNSTDSESDLISTNTGSDLSSTGYDPDSGGPSYGSVQIIKNTESSTPVVEKSKPDVDIAEELGITDTQPKIEVQQPKIEGQQTKSEEQQPENEEQVAQTNVTGQSSNMGSFSIGLLGVLIIVSLILLTLLI